MSVVFYIVARLKEPSTWAGFSAIALAVGISAPEWAAISQFGAAIAGGIAVLVPGS